MTIDELIEKYRFMETKGKIMFPQRPDIAEKSNLQYKETANCLEELKSYRENEEKSENVYRSGYNCGYEKAVDDFVKTSFEMLKAEQEKRFGFLDGMDIREISEKLKGVKQNDD